MKRFDGKLIQCLRRNKHIYSTPHDQKQGELQNFTSTIMGAIIEVKALDLY